ncbi:hypothetical protein M3Y97_00763300 [Aphelenchoides bicaudatus]|nr:hypothetical protein M3Y97_00763300 [Aphelenchoides bicaudatus]
MRQMCPVTCGYCSSGNEVVQPVNPSIYNPPSILCTDSATDCVYWVANGFCTNPFYSSSVRMSYCQASCNLCN